MTAALEIASVSLIGDREVNEDYHATFSAGSEGVAVVCDGLGGSAGGELASEAFGEAIIAQHDRLLHGDYNTRERAREVFNSAFAEGVEQLRARRLGEEPKTTAVVAVVLDDLVAVGHLGDSRACLVAPEGQLWRTRDHSLVQLLVDEGDVSEEAMGSHPDQGKLFKCVDSKGDKPPSVQVYDALVQGQVLVLCSDGFWEHVSPAEMKGLCTAKNLTTMLESLAAAARQRGAGRSDNITAVCLRRSRGGRLQS